jgi:hypothetical protein
LKVGCIAHGVFKKSYCVGVCVVEGWRINEVAKLDLGLDLMFCAVYKVDGVVEVFLAFVSRAWKKN